MTGDNKQASFWEKPLKQLSDDEWEQLCDGCGRCCLKKLQDDESDELLWTRVICRYFKEDTNSCGCYPDRTRQVPECLDVRKMDMGNADWMPDTCAYRLRYEEKPLYDWHPLLSGSSRLMEEAGISVKGRAISEENVHPLGYDEHIIRWVNS